MSEILEGILIGGGVMSAVILAIYWFVHRFDKNRDEKMDLATAMQLFDTEVTLKYGKRISPPNEKR